MVGRCRLGRNPVAAWFVPHNLHFAPFFVVPGSRGVRTRCFSCGHAQSAHVLERRYAGVCTPRIARSLRISCRLTECRRREGALFAFINSGKTFVGVACCLSASSKCAPRCVRSLRLAVGFTKKRDQPLVSTVWGGWCDRARRRRQGQP